MSPEVGDGRFFVSAPGIVLQNCIVVVFDTLASELKRQRNALRFQSFKDGSFSTVVVSLLKRAFASNRDSANLNNPLPKRKKTPDELGTKSLTRKRKAEHALSPSRFPVVEPWGDEVFAISCTLLCAILSNQPAAGSTLNKEGITEAFLEALTPVIWFFFIC